jgi:hypothetical protein
MYNEDEKTEVKMNWNISLKVTLKEDSDAYSLMKDLKKVVEEHGGEGKLSSNLVPTISPKAYPPKNR